MPGKQRRQSLFEEPFPEFGREYGVEPIEEFLPDGIERLAEVAWSVNERTENIGARRLYTVMERLLEEVSFSAGNGGTQVVRIDADYVNGRLTELAKNEDLSRYVL